MLFVYFLKSIPRCDWRKMHNTDLYDLYSKSNIITLINQTTMPRHIYDNNIKMDPTQIGWVGVERIILFRTETSDGLF